MTEDKMKNIVVGLLEKIRYKCDMPKTYLLTFIARDPFDSEIDLVVTEDEVKCLEDLLERTKAREGT